MARWTDQFQSHAIHTSLNAFHDKVREIKSTLDVFSEDDVEALNRLEQVYTYTRNTLSKTDPILATVSLLDELERSSQAVITELDQYISTSDSNYLINANVNADNMIGANRQLFGYTNQDDVDGLNDSLVSLRSLISQIVKEAKDKSESLQQRIDDSNSELTAVRDQINEEKSKLSELATEHERKFSESQAERTSKAREAEIAANTKRDEQEQEFTSRTEEYFSDQEELAKSEIEQIKEYRAEAEKIAQIVADTGMAGGYQKFANEERGRAKFWQGVTLAAFLGLIISAIWAFSATLSSDISAQQFIGRTLVTIPFVLLGAYTGRLAALYSRAERANRKRQLALASINLYLAPLPDEKQHEIREELTPSFFTDDLVEESSTSDAGSENTSWLNVVSDLVRKVPNQPQ